MVAMGVPDRLIRPGRCPRFRCQPCRKRSIGSSGHASPSKLDCRVGKRLLTARVCGLTWSDVELSWVGIAPNFPTWSFIR